MRGDGSPTSISSTRLPPMSVSRKTIAAGSAWTVPMMTASRPDGCERTAASAASATSGATIANSLPSLAIVRGPRPSISQIPRASGRTGIAGSSNTIATSEPIAISFSEVTTTPRVGSRLGSLRSAHVPLQTVTPIAHVNVNSESMLTLQRLIYDVEMIAHPSLEIGDLSQRKHLACPAPVHRNPLIGLGCADESIPITFPDDGAMLWQP